MTLFRPLAPLVLVLLSTAAAVADASVADMASATACQLDRVREIIAGADGLAAGEAEKNQLIVENTADWLPDFNAFAVSPEAGDLLSAVNAVTGKPSAATCRQLLPYAAVAASAERISRAGGEVEAGSVLVTCESDDGLCLPPATAAIVDQCGVALFTLPLRSTC
jgi:hypothetical protein